MVNVMACLVLPDGLPIAVTGSFDSTVRIWDLTTGTLAGHWPRLNHPSSISPGRRSLMSQLRPHSQVHGHPADWGDSKVLRRAAAHTMAYDAGDIAGRFKIC